MRQRNVALTVRRSKRETTIDAKSFCIEFIFVGRSARLSSQSAKTIVRKNVGPLKRELGARRGDG